MKTAISIRDADTNSPIDTHFGRCRHFCIVDSASDERNVVDNSAAADSAQGAGFKAVETIARLGVESVVTGQLGPKAVSALKAAGIQAYGAPEGSKVDDVVAMLRMGKLQRLV